MHILLHQEHLVEENHESYFDKILFLHQHYYFLIIKNLL
jgi:hypothetical protein